MLKRIQSISSSSVLQNGSKLLTSAVSQLKAQFISSSDLIEASKQGDVERVQVVLHYGGVSVNQQIEDGQTALILAVRHAHCDIMRVLLSHPAIQIDSMDKKGYTALIYAISNGHREAVSLLLLFNADIQTPRAGLTPLMHTACVGHCEIAELLLDYRADIHFETEDGKTAADFAHDHQQIKVEKLLINRGASLFSERMERKEAERRQQAEIPEFEDQLARLQAQLGLSEAALHSEQLRVRQLELDLQDSDDQLRQARAFSQSALTQLQTQLTQSQASETTLRQQLQSQRVDFEANLSLAQREMDLLRSAQDERQRLLDRAEASLRLERTNLAGAQMRARELEVEVQQLVDHQQQTQQRVVVMEVEAKVQAETHRRELQRREEELAKSSSALQHVSSESKCVICLERSRSHIVIDCGHFCLCKKCVDDSNLSTCPICRHDVSKIVQVFE